jgi:Xaa-Pro aminopeptidase
MHGKTMISEKEEKNLTGLTQADKEWRYARIRKFMQEQEVDALLLSGNAWEEPNVRYVAGQYFRVGQRYGYVLFPAAGEPEIFAFHPTRAYQYRCIEEFPGDTWFDRPHIHPPTFDALAEGIRRPELSGGRLGIDRAWLDADKYVRLQKEFPEDPAPNP